MVVICKDDLERLSKTNLFFEYVFPNQSLIYYEILQNQIFQNFQRFSKFCTKKFKKLMRNNSRYIVIRRLTHIQELQIR